MYELETRSHLDRIFRKLAKKDPLQHEAIWKKVKHIRENPAQFPPLHAPMQFKRHVHVMGNFVLVYSVDEKRKTVILEDYDHHDRVYRKA